MGAAAALAGVGLAVALLLPPERPAPEADPQAIELPVATTPAEPAEPVIVADVTPEVPPPSEEGARLPDAPAVPPRRIGLTPRARAMRVQAPNEVAGESEAVPELSEAEAAAQEEARRCGARGDNRCVVRALEGRTSSAISSALLIESYRAMGRTTRAIERMREFVTLYPEHDRAAEYRAFLERH